MDKKWIPSLAQNFISSQSFEFSSFNEAKNYLSYRNGLCKKYIIYDRLSLCVYKHNFSYDDEYIQFRKDISKLYKPPNNEHEKRRVEYARLFDYLRYKAKLDIYSITKTEHPDFILKSGDYFIGVEVTELTTQYEKVLDKISSLTEKGMQKDELKIKAVAHHGLKANGYQYHDINGTAIVGTETLRPDNIREMFVQKILNKYLLYESKIEGFNEFIILCDARHGITITKKWEVDDIHDMLLQYSFNKPFVLAILWYNSKLHCTEYQFSRIPS